MTEIDSTPVNLFTIDVDPSKGLNPAYVDNCAEFTREYKETDQFGDVYNLEIILHFRDIDELLLEYDSILVTGDIGMGAHQYEISITSASQVNDAIKLTDMTTGEEITVYEGDFESTAMGYSIYGISGQERTLIFSESNDIH